VVDKVGVLRDIGLIEAAEVVPYDIDSVFINVLFFFQDQSRPGLQLAFSVELNVLLWHDLLHFGAHFAGKKSARVNGNRFLKHFFEHYYYNYKANHYKKFQFE